MCKPSPGRPDPGFTLIEMLVTIVIAAILVVIALPTYQTQIRKSRRTEAKTAILDFAAREERYLATQNVYSSDPGQLQYTATGGSWPVSTGSYYQITTPTVTNPTAASPTALPTFSVTVVPAPGSPQLADSSCQSFTVTQTGLQSSTDSGGSPSTSSCWP